MNALIDLKLVEAIKGIRSEIKVKAAEQKQTRLEKRQKDVWNSMLITVLHRLYLEIRNKPFEEVHKIRKGWESRAQSYETKYKVQFGLE